MGCMYVLTFMFLMCTLAKPPAELEQLGMSAVSMVRKYDTYM